MELGKLYVLTLVCSYMDLEHQVVDDDQIGVSEKHRSVIKIEFDERCAAFDNKIGTYLTAFKSAFSSSGN